MKIIKCFYNKTIYFWKGSRLLLLILFAYAIFNEIDLKNISSLFVCGIMLLQFFAMTYVLISEILKKYPFIGIKIFAGIFAIFFGLLLVVLIFTTQYENQGINLYGFLLLPLWIIFYGLWEIIFTTEISIE